MLFVFFVVFLLVRDGTASSLTMIHDASAIAQRDALGVLGGGGAVGIK